jgi:hypothetical protein
MPNLPFRQRVAIALKVKRIGYYSARQHMLKQGGNLHDVAWLLTSTLTIQGA